MSLFSPAGSGLPLASDGYPAAGGVARRPAGGQESVRANRRWWDAAAPAYLAEHGSDLGDADFLWCPEGLREAEAHLLGDVEGLRVLEIGCGSAPCSRWLRTAGAGVVALDVSAGMLARAAELNRSTGIAVPLLQADAGALPLVDGALDLACSAFGGLPFVADVEGALAEVARVLRPGGRLLLWWNEVRAEGAWWDAQQDRLEAGNPSYRRGYREVDYSAQLAPWFTGAPPREIDWERTLSLELYERWLRSKSYVQALPDVEGFVAGCRADLLEAFPDGQVLEPFVTRLWVLQR
jgi:SAM-dependent methyltransferase